MFTARRQGEAKVSERRRRRVHAAPRVDHHVVENSRCHIRYPFMVRPPDTLITWPVI